MNAVRVRHALCCGTVLRRYPIAAPAAAGEREKTIVSPRLLIRPIGLLRIRHY